MAKYGRENRIQNAQERQKSREKRSNAQQIELLDKRLGVGVGALKERAKLAGQKSEKDTKPKKQKKKTEKIEE